MLDASYLLMMISRGAGRGAKFGFDPTMLASIALKGLNDALNRKPLDSPAACFSGMTSHYTLRSSSSLSRGRGYCLGTKEFGFFLSVLPFGPSLLRH